MKNNINDFLTKSEMAFMKCCIDQLGDRTAIAEELNITKATLDKKVSNILKSTRQKSLMACVILYMQEASKSEESLLKVNQFNYLSASEKTMMDSMIIHKANKGLVAESTGFKPSTISTMIKNLYNKLDLRDDDRNTASLVLLYMDYLKELESEDKPKEDHKPVEAIPTKEPIKKSKELPVYTILRPDRVNADMFNEPILLSDEYAHNRKSYPYTDEELLLMCHLMACSGMSNDYVGAFNNLPSYLGYDEAHLDKLYESLHKKTGCRELIDIVNTCYSQIVES